MTKRHIFASLADANPGEEEKNSPLHGKSISTGETPWRSRPLEIQISLGELTASVLQDRFRPIAYVVEYIGMATAQSQPGRPPALKSVFETTNSDATLSRPAPFRHLGFQGLSTPAKLWSSDPA